MFIWLIDNEFHSLYVCVLKMKDLDSRDLQLFLCILIELHRLESCFIWLIDNGFHCLCVGITILCLCV